MMSVENSERRPCGQKGWRSGALGTWSCAAALASADAGCSVPQAPPLCQLASLTKPPTAMPLTSLNMRLMRSRRSSFCTPMTLATLSLSA